MTAKNLDSPYVAASRKDEPLRLDIGDDTNSVIPPPQPHTEANAMDLIIGETT